MNVTTIHQEIMCTKTCTKVVGTDSAGIRQDSLEMHEILPLKNGQMRAIPTLAYRSRCLSSN